MPSSDEKDCEPSTSSGSDEEDTDIFLLAKSYFDLKALLQHTFALSIVNEDAEPCISSLQEYRRVAHVLRTSAGNKARFLRCYSLYLAGEKRKEYACCSAPTNAAHPLFIHMG